MKLFFVDILNSFYINGSIFFLKVTFWNPNRTHIMYPNIMTSWLINRISWFIEVIVIKFLFIFIILVLFTFRYEFVRMNIFLLLFVIRTLFSIFTKSRISLFPKIRIYVDVGSFHCSSFHIAQRTGKIDACRSKSKTYITHPTLCWNFCQAYTSLMQTNIASGTKND